MLALFALIAVLFFSPPQSKPDCRQIEALTGGVEETWLGYEQGGWDLPEDRKITDRIDFAGRDGGIWEMTAKSTPGIRWLFVFGDYETDGEPLGAHHFCLVRITDD